MKKKIHSSSSDEEVAQPIPSSDDEPTDSDDSSDQQVAQPIPSKNTKPSGCGRKRSIQMDMKEYQNSYVFDMDMPGMKSDDIKVEVEDDNVVEITGERKREEGGGVNVETCVEIELKD